MWFLGFLGWGFDLIVCGLCRVGVASWLVVLGLSAVSFLVLGCVWCVAVSGFSGCVVFGGSASCGFCLLQLLLVFLVVC